MELSSNWDKHEVMCSAAANGHVHVLEWAIENGASLVSPRAQDIHKRLLENACIHGHVSALEWLIKTYPPILELVDLRDILTRTPGSKHWRILDILASHVGTAKVLEVMQSLASNEHSFSCFRQVKWCTKRGMLFDAKFFHTMMLCAAEIGSVSLMEHYLRAGGAWRAEYFHMALKANRLTFCQWAHKRSDLELDLSRAENHFGCSKEMLVWLASVGVLLRLMDKDIFQRLAYADTTGILPYIIEHYPRYLFIIM